MKSIYCVHVQDDHQILSFKHYCQYLCLLILSKLHSAVHVQGNGV